MSDKRNAKDIFLDAVENYQQSEWPAMLDRACGADNELRIQVDNLLNAHLKKDDLLDAVTVEKATHPVIIRRQNHWPLQITSMHW